MLFLEFTGIEILVEAADCFLFIVLWLVLQLKLFTLILSCLSAL